MGLVMAMWLCGCMWMIVGIGDAAISREGMQDGADAAVYASAVYHARGMNVIAMINLVMAALLSVLAALKVSELLNQIYFGIVTANCLCVPFGCPFDCPFVPLSAALASDLSGRISAMEPMVDATLTALSAKQKMIAITVPHQGKARSEEVLKDFYKTHIDEGAAVSISMIPGGKRIGLPVQEDKHDKLCEKARTVILEVVLNPLIAYGLPFAPSGAFFMVAGMAPGAVYYITATLCEDSDSNGKTPKKVFEDAKNGNEYFQVYSFVLQQRGIDTARDRADPGTELLVDEGAEAQAEGEARAESKPFDLQTLSMAEAEFYYDDSGSWDGMKDEAMWNMRWRARLRRYRDPPPQVAALAPGNGALRIKPYVDEVIH
jgi:hypothetical protein